MLAYHVVLTNLLGDFICKENNPIEYTNFLGLGKSVISLLARWPKDGLYYAVEVLECDSARKSCNVHFEDGTDCWLPNKEIHLQLDWEHIKDDENIVCCICDDGASKTPNEILMCDSCEQGYHIQCHDPPIDRDTTNFDDEDAWYCATCKHLESIVTPKPAEKRKQVKQTPAKKMPAKKKAKERGVEQGILDSSSSSSSLSSSPSNVSPAKKSIRKSKKINKVKKESIVETKDLLERVSPELKRERRKENRSSQVKIKVASRKSKKVAEAF